MSFNETNDVKIKTQTLAAQTVLKVVNKKLTTKLVAGDALVITVKGNDVFNGNIPASKEIKLVIKAQINDV